MVLVTHHIQGSYATFSPRTFSRSKGIRLKQNGVRLQMTSRIDSYISVKYAYPFRSATRSVHFAKEKPLRIACFKGNVRNDEAGDPTNNDVLPKSSVKVSFVQQERKETLTEPPKAEDMPVCSTSESHTSSRSQAIRGLFIRWLNLLHTGSRSQVVDVPEGQPQVELHQEKKAANMKERGEVLKVVWSYFLGLDATVTIPLLLFVPLYLGINVAYGAEVSRELTPLWIIGPLVVALYVKLFRLIAALYVFSFKQSVKIAKNMPTYLSIASTYINEGKLKDDIQTRWLEPMFKVKNMGSKELSRVLWKAFQEWLLEKYLDFVESIWPYYCRTIRFLKRANLI